MNDNIVSYKICQNGDLYIGNWENGKKQGYGLYKTTDGCFYKGNWLNDTMHGYGIYIGLLGIYEGNWVNGWRDGLFKITYANNNVYEGNIKRDYRDGFGKLTYANKSYYEGNWVYNIRVGKGIYFDSKSKLTYSGDWHQNKKLGLFTITSADKTSTVKAFF